MIKTFFTNLGHWLYHFWVWLFSKGATYRNLDELLSSNLIGHEKEFNQWAFGYDSTKDIPLMTLLCEWNHRHGNKLYFYPDSLISNCVFLMQELYHQEHYGLHTDTASSTSAVANIANDTK